MVSREISLNVYSEDTIYLTVHTLKSNVNHTRPLPSIPRHILVCVLVEIVHERGGFDPCSGEEEPLPLFGVRRTCNLVGHEVHYQERDMCA